MYYSSIHNTLEDTIYPQPIKDALQYLRNNDFEAMECGVYELSGKDFYAQVFEVETKPVEEGRPESHKKYVDVQFLVSGRERIGFTLDNGRYEIEEDLLAERDLLFYKSVENEGFLPMTPGCFAVFFPNDIHRPACEYGGVMGVKKVVLKVAEELFHAK